MSFKREGNDYSLLQQIRKRRIEELFTYDIPEEEALLLRDGRLTCTVCPHRPILDTIAVLAVHRQGKKHAANAEKKKTIHPIVPNSYMPIRAQRPSTQNETKSAESSHGNALMLSAPYNSCVKRRREDGDCGVESNTSEILAGDNEHDEHDIMNRNISGVSVLKRLVKFQQFDSAPSDLRPYKSKRKTANTTVPRNLPSSEQTKGDHTVTDIPVDVWHSKCVTGSKTVCQDQELEKSNHCNQTKNSRDKNYWNGIQHLQTANDSVKQMHRQESANKRNSSDKTSGTEDLTEKKKENALHTPNKTSVHTEKQILAEKYMQAVQSGWKKDPSGKWVKDETVEFDSDEEPPDIP